MYGSSASAGYGRFGRVKAMASSQRKGSPLAPPHGRGRRGGNCCRTEERRARVRWTDNLFQVAAAATAQAPTGGPLRLSGRRRRGSLLGTANLFSGGRA